MHSKRSAEGYLLIDHSDSPGLTDEQIRRTNPDAPAGSGRAKYELPTVHCSHCQRGMIANPLRTRERAYCRRCDAYICDDCKLSLVLTGECKPFAKVMDQAMELAVRGRPIPIFTRTSHG